MMRGLTNKTFLAVGLALVILAAGFGCGPGPKELYDTAELEVLQNSHEHAAKLFRRIIEKYPESEYAAKAKQRLEELGRGATGTGGES